MTGRTHDLIAFGALLTGASIYPPTNLNLFTAVGCFIGSTIGALIPDMDQASNRLWDLLPAGNFVGRIFRRVMIGHRTISHSILGVYLIYKGLFFLLPRILNSSYVDINLIVYSLMIGVVSHLFADAFTKEGIPLFFPLKVKVGIPPIKSLRITTGEFFENFLVFPGTVAYIFWTIYIKKEVFVEILQNIRA
jgi:inner membrane protein